MLLCSLEGGLTANICMLCFVVINSIVLNLLCLWILYQNAGVGWVVGRKSNKRKKKQ